MTIFDDYKDNKGRNTVSPTLLWEYDLTHFDWQRSRKIVVQRIIERGWLKDYFAAFDLYGGIEGFREIIKEVPSLSARDMNFVCTVFNLKKEELRCYTRKLSRLEHLRTAEKTGSRTTAGIFQSGRRHGTGALSGTS